MLHPYYQFKTNGQVTKYVQEVAQDRKIVDYVNEHTWSMIREAVAAISTRLKPHWEVHYHQASVTFRTRNGTHVMKITTGAEVFTDVKLKGKLEFKSRKFVGDSIGSATEHLMTVMEQYLLPAVH